ncbi:guanylate kinase [Fulvivirga sp. 29W222]|uniref:Guanylate kinase n=1 Tax=Fulvivirga marina TaxID=2494733 RepID=A0A937FWZ4_9BACT|nr:guanylate kinase [Fulvivirga marina]MBL6446557.1 guanylate kinase [Fulvivirga marina]
MHNGKAIIFSAPSGSGKTTIVKHLLATNPKLGFSISACTRDKRGRNEENGKDYYFLTPGDFKRKIDNEEFIEWEEVYAGNFYGTLKSEVERIWQEGRHVIFDVDVKGGLHLKEYFGERALAVFVKVPSIDELKDRLMDRQTETENSLSQRVFKAKFEMTFEDKFDVTLINKDLDESLKKAEELVDNFINSDVKAI